MSRALGRTPTVLRLYVAGNAPNSVTAITNLRALLAAVPADQLHLEIVDVLDHPDRAARDGVLVTPTALRVLPTPERRVIGSLENHEVVRAALGLLAGADE